MERAQQPTNWTEMPQWPGFHPDPIYNMRLCFVGLVCVPTSCIIVSSQGEVCVFQLIFFLFLPTCCCQVLPFFFFFFRRKSSLLPPWPLKALDRMTHTCPNILFLNGNSEAYWNMLRQMDFTCSTIFRCRKIEKKKLELRSKDFYFHFFQVFLIIYNLKF